MRVAKSIREQETRIWQIALDNPFWDRFLNVLSSDECARMARFRTPKLQQYHGRCRSALRMILAHYLNQPPSALAFSYGQFGKPALVGHSLQFNLSHSGDCALIAVSQQEIGIDIELMSKTRIDLAGLIDMVCHPQEKAELSILPESEKLSLFYRLWTKKEAYCKLRGVGLQQSLSALHFAATPDHAVHSVIVDDNKIKGLTSAAPNCFVHALDEVKNEMENYSASVCLTQANVTMSFFSTDAVLEAFIGH